MGKRLTGFDYSRPYYYMVTIKRCREAAALSEIVAPGRCQLNAITRAYVHVIRHFHEERPEIAPIECFSVMPDHLHLLIRILDYRSTALRVRPNEVFVPLRLEAIVGLLMQELEARYAEVTGQRGRVFEASWHDWIVSKEGQLMAFTRYIRENPERSYLRAQNRQFFQSVRAVQFLGREWFGYGNLALLDLPVLTPMRYSRSIVPNSEEWQRAVAAAERIGPGGAGVGTFMSPLEKACGNALGVAGGKWIVLSPEGFGPRWHPAREYERYCAEGRMLFLSLYPAMAREPSKAELYERCHKMGDIIVAGLS